MCGIAGIVDFRGFDPELLARMVRIVHHRGPDGSGAALVNADNCLRIVTDMSQMATNGNQTLGLGHSRLAILDTSSAGNQPMLSDDGQLCISHNGEVYNYREIRQTLETYGYRFQTGTDTEVILKSYQRWGVDCLSRFNGMWAFAIYDLRQRQLFCARDRLGVKPFCYHHHGSLFLFGSEIKQLLLHPEITTQPSEAAAFAFLDSGLLGHTHHTFFEDVIQLPPAHYLLLDIASKVAAPKIYRYWKLQDNGPSLDTDTQAIDRFREKLTHAVDLRMRSDVPVGSCLSGGLDSSSIVCLATQSKPPHSFHTFSCYFDDPKLDERQYISTVVNHTKVVSHLVTVDAHSFWRDFSSLIWHQEVPPAGGGVYAQWAVMKAAANAGVTVLLDGQGADEALCGYSKFYVFYLTLLARGFHGRFLTEALSWALAGSRSYWLWDDLLKYSGIARRLQPSPAYAVGEQDFIQRQQHGSDCSLGVGDSLRMRQLRDIEAYSLPALLHYEDRNSMAHSIESRQPFLDYELLEWTVNSRDSLKLRHGWTKWMLRQALRNVLPEQIRLRKTKLAFDTPMPRWLTTELAVEVRAFFHDAEIAMPFFHRKRLLAQVHKFSIGAPDALSPNRMFRILALETWARVFGSKARYSAVTDKYCSVAMPPCVS